MDFSTALPKLATVQWREGPPIGQQTEWHLDWEGWEFSPTLVARQAAESPAGLRLLQTEKCSFRSVAGLPASLQILSLWKRLSDRHLLQARLDLLLAPCAALRELYLLHMYTSAVLDVPAIAAACPELRVLVLRVVVERVLSPPCRLACFGCDRQGCCRPVICGDCWVARIEHPDKCYPPVQAAACASQEGYLPHLEVLVLSDVVVPDMLLLRWVGQTSCYLQENKGRLACMDIVC